MITKEELKPILITILVLTISLNLFRSISLMPIILLSVFLVVMINILAKKITSFYLDSEIEMRLWNLEGLLRGFRLFRGFHPNNPPYYKRFKKPFQAGVFFPILSRVIFYPLGNFVWMASLIFEVKPKVYRAAKRHGLYSYSEMTESHIGLIAASGIVANLLFALAGYLIGFPEFSKINIYMAFFNMIPISDLDGNKIFFGNNTLWIFLAALVTIAVGYNLFLI
ncbi:MAG: hypothetical protein Q8P81_04030 [Nanoarchaeota archaeon]|nr:hypothetical protein [Nanoarchaeota archaeon]